MADRKPPKSTKVASSGARNSRTGGAAKGGAPDGFSKEEKAAMKERARELKAEARAGKDRADGERAVLATLAKMPAPDRALGERIHEIVSANAPALLPRLWYGMPAYGRQDGKVVCFFQAATKFKTRYATFAFSDAAHLDDGAMWSTGFALRELNASEVAKIGALVRKAVD